MITITIRIEDYGGVPWVYPAKESAVPLFKFVTGGLIGVPGSVWSDEIEPVIKALEWSWSVSPAMANT